METPNEFQPLMDVIFRDKVRWARQERQANVLSLVGLEMFESGLAGMREGLRNTLSEPTEENVNAEIARRLEIRRCLDERGIYQPVE